MRNLLAIHMFILSIALSQHYVTVEGDSVEFGMMNLSRNCGAEFVMNVELTDNIFNITAIDSGGMALCGSCNFDVQVVVGGIEPGNYEAYFYTYDIYDIIQTDSTWEYIRDTTFIGETDFVIDNPPISPYSILSSYQSPCSHTQDIDDEIHPIQPTIINNYPNPFNPTTTIIYELPVRLEVTLSIYDIMGRNIQTLVKTTQPSGNYETHWNGTDYEGKQVPAGMYFARLQAGAPHSVGVHYSSVVKMVYLR